jgi:UDP-N-acetylmuramate--alanine ligase
MEQYRMERVHFIGIGGSGLSAIARLLAQRGVSVSGSDRVFSPLAQELAAAGIPVAIGHAAGNVLGASLVVRSSAVPDDNPEVVAARAGGIPVLKRAEFLNHLLADKQVVAVAGTHGKTTTTAMLAWVLTSLHLDPSYIIGGVAVNLGNNAHAGQSDYFVIEADEYDRMFLGLRPQVTYLEHDHPDCYPTFADYTQAFEQFAGLIKPGGTLITCADRRETFELAFAVSEGVSAFSYGLSTPSHYRIANAHPNTLGGFSGEVLYQGNLLTSLDLQVPGEHNLSNALAALAVAHRLSLDLSEAAAALHTYQGTGRRFELLGEAQGIAVIDDYAHHPTEIRATLAAARARFAGRRIWAVWQPHTYTRTLALMDQFRTAFTDADRVIVTEIYAARENTVPFSAARVVEGMRHPAAKFIPDLDQVSRHLLQNLLPGDVLLVLCAGDADRISSEVLAQLRGGNTHGHA